MHTTERHRNKRPFQPSITTFFARDAQDSDDDDDRWGINPNSRPRPLPGSKSSQQQRESLAPQVPGQVQADLLQVGMRVRKSVPEGYKTHPKMSTLPTIQTTLAKPTTTISAVGLDVKPPRDPVPDAVLHQRELLPFCGLHKIGGYAEQPTTNIHLYAGGDTRPTNPFPLLAEAFTQPFSSQGSTDSGYGSESQRKRSWQDEDEARLDISGSNFFFAIPMKGNIELDDIPVSPLSESPQKGINMLPSVRQFAQPKSRKARLGMSMDEDIDMEIENVDARVAVGSASDFEEADFLAAGEVAMGGV
ncbi:ribonucleotide reductase inhibitor-domain-containing protein [Paraphoma chrysanthemicola]|uniref:Ribonucleotide reductase inhibitor-domain-containing protein n=1 Tax=Paraphoma chrysanthemicola TaxID=798071 RepID=A0A8K0QUR5_9PLEO|nr:ribonucleotide reductase inhibitor-domain-containing protein [Paraphoma chrysanthemicola]